MSYEVGFPKLQASLYIKHVVNLHGMLSDLTLTFITRGKNEINRISLQTRSRMAAVSCFCVMIVRWKKSRLIRYGYVTPLWEPLPISATIPWELTFNIDNKVFHFAWLTKIENRSRSLWHPRLWPAWPAVEISCIRSFRAPRTLLCFDKYLQTHQSVDSRNGIIAFLFKRYIDAFSCCLNFSAACPDQCECTHDPGIPWFPFKGRVLVSCERKNLTSIPLQFPLITTTL